MQQIKSQEGHGGLAVAALVLGIVAIVGSWMPILNNVSAIIAFVGAVLGIIALATANKKMRKKGLAIAGTVLSVLAFVFVLVTQAYYSAVLDGVSDSLSASTTNQSSSSQSSSEGSGEAQATDLTLDTPFEFDDLTITLGSGITEKVLENQFSDYDGSKVIGIPITVTNNASETHGLNMFYYKAYGPNGTELNDITTYFMDDDVAWAGEARSGATLESTLHVLYDGNGDYYLEFAKPFGETIEVRIPVEAAV